MPEVGRAISRVSEELIAGEVELRRQPMAPNAAEAGEMDSDELDEDVSRSLRGTGVVGCSPLPPSPSAVKLLRGERRLERLLLRRRERPASPSPGRGDSGTADSAELGRFSPAAIALARGHARGDEEGKSEALVSGGCMVSLFGLQWSKVTERSAVLIA